MRKLRHTVLCILLGMSIAGVASAQPRSKSPAPRADSAALAADVETAEQLYTKLDYEKANETADRVLKQRNLSHDQLIRAYRILAVTYAILDKQEQARDAFLRLLIFDPEYTVDTNLGPKVSTPFIEARGQYRSLPSKPGIEVMANVRDEGGQLRITTRDPTRMTKKVTVGHRWTAAGTFTTQAIAVGDATVEIPPATPGRTRLDYYVIAVDDRDNVIFEAGSPQVPKSTFIEAGSGPAGGGSTSGPGAGDKKRSFFGSPVFWIIAGAAVVGGGVATFFALRNDDPEKATLSPQIRCGNALCK